LPPALRVLVVTWAPGGNLAPLLAVASLLAARGHHVELLGSAATRPGAGVRTHAYRRAPDPLTDIAFEHQAGAMLATAAGPALALDVRDVLLETGPDVVVADCMLPAALAAGLATGAPTVSLVHFLYGPARRSMLRHGGGWTTDLAALEDTHRVLGLPPAPGGLAAWEAPELLLVAAPRWLDGNGVYPEHVVHAGPLGVRMRDAERSRVLLSFSTTPMHGQVAAIQRVLDAVAASGLEALLTLGPALDAAALRTPENVEVVAFADHDAVLPECRAVVTHGGLGTTLRALAHGVPLLLLPLGRDQHVNAARVAELGAGRALDPERPPADLRVALEALLGEPAPTHAAAGLAARIAADEPDRRAVEALERASTARPAGRRLRTGAPRTSSRRRSARPRS
jgi:UDP:flavonoid glycosyltransferase YjiC (YdhE family)